MRVAGHHWPAELLMHHTKFWPLEEAEVRRFYGDAADGLLCKPMNCINHLVSVSYFDVRDLPEHIRLKYTRGIKLYVPAPVVPLEITEANLGGTTAPGRALHLQENFTLSVAGSSAASLTSSRVLGPAAVEGASGDSSVSLLGDRDDAIEDDSDDNGGAEGSDQSRTPARLAKDERRHSAPPLSKAVAGTAALTAAAANVSSAASSERIAKGNSVCLGAAAAAAASSSSHSSSEESAKRGAATGPHDPAVIQAYESLFSGTGDSARLRGPPSGVRADDLVLYVLHRGEQDKARIEAGANSAMREKIEALERQKVEDEVRQKNRTKLRRSTRKRPRKFWPCVRRSECRRLWPTRPPLGAWRMGPLA
jgi:hypothetical protein